MKKWIIISTLATLSAVASAQNVMAFKDAEFQDLFVTQTGNTFTLSLGDNPMVKASVGNGQWNEIKDVTGFWLLSDDGDLSATGSDFGVWDWHLNTPGSGKNSDFGWKTEKKNGILANGSQTFTFDSINGGGIDGFGFMLHANGTPAHVRMNAQPVPEPASMFALATGAAVLIRRRRNKK